MELNSGYQRSKWYLTGIMFGLLVFLSARANGLVILQYHHVSNLTPAATSISPKQFKAHMREIAASGYRVVGLPEVLQALRQRSPLPDKAVLITFDDGSQSVLDAALPVLSRHGWPFVVFVSTEPVEQRQKGTLSWDGLRQLAAEGAAIANHGVSHAHMIRYLEGETAAQWRVRIRQEIVEAEAKIKAEVGQSHRAFAYPYGEFSEPLLALVAELGFVGFGQHSGAPAARDIGALPRFPFGGNYVALEDLKLKLRALPLPFEHIRYLNQAGDLLNDGVLSATEARPMITMSGASLAQLPDLACYISGQGVAIRHSESATEVSFQAKKPLNAGRTRYNCTAKSPQSGRFYWHSSPFIKPKLDGSWAAEPV